MRVTLTALASAALLSLAAPATAASAAPSPQVLVVAVPDLRWSDVSADATPTLWRLIGSGAAGALTVKSSYQLAGCADGLLSLGAGDRAAAEPAAAAPLGCVDRTPEEFVQLNHDIHGTSGLGRLGQELRSHGLTTGTLGAGGSLALPRADRTGPLTGGLAAVTGADVVLAVDDQVYAASRSARAAAVRAMDRQLAQLVDPLPATSTVLVVGSSDRPAQPGDTGPADSAHLHVAVAHGPAFVRGDLSSPSTKRPPYVELIDVAPTVLRLVGAPVPSAVVGRPWEDAGERATAASTKAGSTRCATWT